MRLSPLWIASQSECRSFFSPQVILPVRGVLGCRLTVRRFRNDERLFSLRCARPATVLCRFLPRRDNGSAASRQMAAAVRREIEEAVARRFRAYFRRLAASRGGTLSSPAAGTVSVPWPPAGPRPTPLTTTLPVPTLRVISGGG